MAATYTQENRLMAIATPLGEDVLLLAGFSGEEGISRLFRFDLDLLSTSESLDYNSIVGQNATVRLTLASGNERYFNGFISRFSQGGRVLSSLPSRCSWQRSSGRSSSLPWHSSWPSDLL